MPVGGKLGKAALAANTDTDLYTVPTGLVATANVCFVNRTAAPIAVRLAVRTGAIADADYLEYGVSIPANGVLERMGIALSAAEIVTVRASAAGVTCRVHGYEEQVQP